MDKQYEVQLEVAGPLALFTRPDTGAPPTSYPVPTWSAVKGIFESIAFLKDGSAWIRPTRVEVCKRKDQNGGDVRFIQYTTNYGGPLRKADQFRKGVSFQLRATVLQGVCYRLYGEVLGTTRRAATGLNSRHHLQSMFQRRIEIGQCHRTPCLGLSEFTASYWGGFRDAYTPDRAINLVIPSMLYSVWSDPVSGTYQPEFRQDVKVVAGEMIYAQ